jgi:hypothetical protein
MTSYKKMLVYLFIASGQIAGVLNVIASVLSARDGGWGYALLYLLIAFMLYLFTIVGWYQAMRQPPYRPHGHDDGG